MEINYELKLFVKTCKVKINLKLTSYQETCEKIIRTNKLTDTIITVNTNFGSIGDETRIKIKEKKQCGRKIQGSGICFNNAIEPVILSKKIYLLKWFPTTGEILIPGIKEESYDEIAKIVAEFINYMIFIGLTSSVEIIPNSVQSTMINGKMNLLSNLSNVRLHIWKIMDILNGLREFGNVQRLNVFSQNTKKISFNLKVSDDELINIVIFYSGKLLLLGAKTDNSLIRAKEFISDLFMSHKDNIVKELPVPDN